MASRGFRVGLTGIAAFAGFLAGAGLAGNSLHPPAQPAYYRLPHHVPKSPGELSLRFAMVHEVVHERFPKFGPQHYEARNRLTREKLTALAPDDAAAWPLADELAVGLVRLGKPDEATAILREKLARQEARGPGGRDRYSTYANLGTSLMLGSFRGTVAGDPAARERFRESVEYVRRSIAVNPDAHFGREAWQAVLGDFVLAASERPALLRESDFVGNKLDEDVDPLHGRAARQGYGYYARQYADRLRDPDTIALKEECDLFRDHVTRVGYFDPKDAPKDGWKPKAVAFDEPVLGIIGMWRQGGGANPHFALALGEIMLRVGQRYVAWEAFERTYRLADGFGPDAASHQFLRDHCRKRQARIEATLPPAEVATLRPRFEAELAAGEGYQKAYQDYEAAKLAAGASVADEHLFDDFHKGRPPIASPTGPEEWYAVDIASPRVVIRLASVATAWGLLGAGLAALLTARLVRHRAGPPALELRECDEDAKLTQ